MKKFYMIILMIVIVIPLRFIGSSAALPTVLNENFESYSTLDHIKSVWGGTDDKSANGGIIALQNQIGYNSENSKVCFINATKNGANASDPYLSKDINMSGKTVVNFKIKPLDLKGIKKLFIREATSGGTVFTDLFEIQAGGTFKCYGQVINGISATANEWYDISVVTDINRADTSNPINKYTLYINGNLYARDVVFTTTNNLTTFASIGFRVTAIEYILNETSAFYIDDIILQKSTDSNFNSTVSMPANNSQNIPVDTSSLKISLNNIIDVSTLNISGIIVTKERSETIENVNVEKKVNSNEVKITFQQQLDMNTFYTIELPIGIKDVFGTELPSTKCKYIFGTVPDPNNAVPIVSIVSPRNNLRVDPNTTINIKANATDGDGTIAKVIFYSDGVEIGRVTTQPYECNWSNAQNGAHILSCKTYDNGGAVSISEGVSINVNYNVAPTVTLTNPTANSEFIFSNAISMSADATDSDGSIARVEFYIDGVLISEDTTAPYAISWTASAVKQYTYYVKAYDNEGTVKKSTIAIFSVTKKIENTLLSNDFNLYTATAETPMSLTNFVANTNSPIGKIYSTIVDEHHGRSVMISTDVVTATGGPNFNASFTRVESGLVAIESELYFSDTQHSTIVFAAKSNASLFSGDIMFNESGNIVTMETGGAQLNIGSYSPNRWYKVKQVFNVSTKKYDFYIDDVKVVSEHAFFNTSLADISSVRLTFNSPTSAIVGASVCVDNFRVIGYSDYPKVTGISFSKEDGSIVTGIAPFDTKKININFNSAMRVDLISDYIKVYKYNHILVPISVEYNVSTNQCMLTLSNSVEKSMKYLVAVKKGLRTTAGVENENDIVNEFRTDAGSSGVKAITFKSNGGVINSSYEIEQGVDITATTELTNYSSGKLDAVIILALFKDGQMVKAVNKFITVPTNTNSLTIDTSAIHIIDESENYRVKVFVWDKIKSGKSLMAEVAL